MRTKHIEWTNAMLRWLESLQDMAETITYGSGAAVAFCRGQNREVIAVEVAQPMGLAPCEVEAIHTDITERLPKGFRIAEGSYRFDFRTGTHFKRWDITS